MSLITVVKVASKSRHCPGSIKGVNWDRRMKLVSCHLLKWDPRKHYKPSLKGIENLYDR